MGFLDVHRDKIYAVLRIVTGFLFLWHGSQKLFGWPGGGPDGAPALVVYVAGPIELIGGVLLIFGLKVRPVSFLCSGLMAAAYWMAHGTKALLPILNHGELAMLYCFLFLFMAAEGAGIWSLDNRGDGG
ncbi:MAG: LuxR family transcriptional regulator [Deltaproteobacteria bacterium]|nr:LuxR family transcriptional regulator [Deltaproteobacteria bacterium]